MARCRAASRRCVASGSCHAAGSGDACGGDGWCGSSGEASSGAGHPHCATTEPAASLHKQVAGSGSPFSLCKAASTTRVTLIPSLSVGCGSLLPCTTCHVFALTHETSTAGHSSVHPSETFIPGALVAISPDAVAESRQGRVVARYVGRRAGLPRLTQRRQVPLQLLLRVRPQRGCLHSAWITGVVTIVLAAG